MLVRDVGLLEVYKWGLSNIIKTVIDNWRKASISRVSPSSRKPKHHSQSRRRTACLYFFGLRFSRLKTSCSTSSSLILHYSSNTWVVTRHLLILRLPHVLPAPELTIQHRPIFQCHSSFALREQLRWQITSIFPTICKLYGGLFCLEVERYCGFVLQFNDSAKWFRPCESALKLYPVSNILSASRCHIINDLPLKIAAILVEDSDYSARMPFVELSFKVLSTWIVDLPLSLWFTIQPLAFINVLVYSISVRGKILQSN